MPELFTSLIGAVVTVNDVGFGTIVGSAVFNVLAVIGACGMCAEEAIQLTWWPLFRDCTYYIFGLTLLACCAYGKTVTTACGDKEGGGSISFVETVVLFGAYVGYCILMYFSGTLQAKVQGMLDRCKGRAQSQDAAAIPTIKVAPMPDAESKGETEPLKDLRAGGVGEGTASGPPGHHMQASGQEAPGENAQAKEPQDKEPQGAGLELAPKAAPRRGSMLGPGGVAGPHHHIEHHIRVVHHKVHLTKEGAREVRRNSKGLVSPRSEDEERRPSNRSQGSKVEEKVEEGVLNTDGVEETKEDDADSEESDDIAALMIRPEDTKERIMWYISLPIY